VRIVDGTDRDLTDGVAVRVAALGLDGAGRLSDKLLVGVAVRGGLLLDLALAGRVESDVDSVVVDPTPTGFAPADGLLAAISVERERSLDGWLDETRIRLRDVGEANVASGRWERRPSPWGLGRRYTDLRSARTARDRAMVPSRSDAAWTPEDACVAAVACAAGLLEHEGGQPPRDLIVATGAVAWLCAAVVEHLLVADARFRSQAGALGAGPVGPF
jgi:hypothetical protein